MSAHIPVTLMSSGGDPLCLRPCALLWHGPEFDNKPRGKSYDQNVSACCHRSRRIARWSPGVRPDNRSIASSAAAEQRSTGHHCSAKWVRPAECQQPAGAPQASTGNTIQSAQQALQQSGFYKGTVDGKMGPHTRQAIKSFQQSKGLHATGHPNQKTLTALGVTG